MANFLNRMAARVLGSAPVAQPVVPALFAPGFGLTQNAADQAGLASSHSEVEVAVPTATPVLAYDSTLPREWQPSLPTEDSSVTRTESPQTQDPSQGTVSLNLLSPATVAGPLSEPAQDPATENSVFSHEDARAKGSKRVATTHEGAEGRIIESHRHTVFEPVVVAQAIPTRRLATTPLRAGPSLPVNSRSALRRDYMDAATEPPVIRVTIGRIDVRAQFPPAASSPAPIRRTRPATLTVDEYLKQRSEGKR